MKAGGYGEYVLAPRHVVHRLPDSVSSDAAVLVEPPRSSSTGCNGKGLIPPSIGVVTHRFPAERFKEAFDLMENREGVVGKALLEHVPG
jgi:threonine dehydrogenase-like Zn-dependent dehydrogenase